MADSLGEVITTGGASGLTTWLSSALCLIGLGIYALLSGRPSNDDDDSSPGGGIMQPVA